LLEEQGMPNKYWNYGPQHVSENSPQRKRYKEIFGREVQNSKYLTQVKNYFEADYQLINKVTFYGQQK
jgi:hypothetical protein